MWEELISFLRKAAGLPLAGVEMPDIAFDTGPQNEDVDQPSWALNLRKAMRSEDGPARPALVDEHKALNYVEGEEKYARIGAK